MATEPEGFVSGELDLDLPPAFPRPVLVRPRVTLEAMCWLPGDLAAAGACVGWLTASGVYFDHPDGVGGETLLRIMSRTGESVTARPGDWVIRGLKAFMACDPETFAEAYEEVPK